MQDHAWKCFRCDLSFRDDVLAMTHKGITGHAVSKVKIITA